VVVGKLLGADADEVDMLALFQDEAGGLNGVAKALDTGHATGSHAAAVHEEGVKLNAAVRGEEAALSGVECGVVFEDCDGCFDGVEGRASAGEDGLAGLKGGANACFMGGSRIGWNGPCATMNEESGSVGGMGGHRDMVVHCAAMGPNRVWRVVGF
jgi:hypothetical protein